MDLCSDGHDEVCYDGKTCPVCAEMVRVADLEKEVEKLNGIIDDLNNAPA